MTVTDLFQWSAVAVFAVGCFIAVERIRDWYDRRWA